MNGNPLEANRRQWLQQSLSAAGVLAAGRTRAVAASEEAAARSEMNRFDKMMESLLKETGAPGASVAVARNDRLVYARGFGLADRELGVPVTADSRFRIASLSKPITATSILQLVDGELLTLDDAVVEVLELPEPKDERWRAITIRHLLQHRAGFDSRASFDPMFRSTRICEELGAVPPAMPDLIIRYMLQRPLDFEPGAKYAYSNFGYSLLGRVVERVSGLPYELSVRRTIARPLGMNSLQMGRTLSASEGEVLYYDDADGLEPAVMGDIGRKVSRPYGAWCLEAMDAHGGWIASASDLVRFAAAFHDLDASSLLSAKACREMIAPPEGPAGHDEEGLVKEVFYGCGWSVRRLDDSGRVNIWHNGGLPGTSTLLVRRHDRISFAVLFNARRPLVDTPDESEDNAEERRKDLVRRVDPLMHKTINAIDKWPEGTALYG
jgi:N-acyl-D-amino-acid deacylase